MKNLSGDPYEGARRAFFILNHNCNDEDWEKWKSLAIQKGHYDFGRLFADICREAQLNLSDKYQHRDLIAYSLGWFESFREVSKALLPNG